MSMVNTAIECVSVCSLLHSVNFTVNLMVNLKFKCYGKFEIALNKLNNRPMFFSKLRSECLILG